MIYKCMKPFKPTYLYIKTHIDTGLRYFGKTSKDPFKYMGSGRYWLSHLKKYGNNVKTEILGYYIDKNECEKVAVEFSIKNNIVHAVNEENKKIWANQIPENGLDGGATKWGPLSEETKHKISQSHFGIKQTEESRQKIKIARAKQDMSHMKTPKSVEHKRKISETLTGKKQSEETIRKRSESIKLSWIKRRS